MHDVWLMENSALTDDLMDYISALKILLLHTLSESPTLKIG